MATPIRSAMKLDALNIEEQAATSALSQRRATNLWGYMVYALGAPTGVLVAVAGLSAVTANTTAAVVFAILATVSASLMNVMNPAAKVAEHKIASSRFRALENRAHAFVDLDLLSDASDEDLRTRFDELLARLNEVDEKSPDVADRLQDRAYCQVRRNPRYAELHPGEVVNQSPSAGRHWWARKGRARSLAAAARSA
jgi:hypothetical protein